MINKKIFFSILFLSHSFVNTTVNKCIRAYLKKTLNKKSSFFLLGLPSKKFYYNKDSSKKFRIPNDFTSADVERFFNKTTEVGDIKMMDSTGNMRFDYDIKHKKAIKVYDAILYSDVDGGKKLASLIAGDFDLNECYFFGRSPIESAAIENCPEAVELLIKAGFDVDKKNSALCFAVKHNSVESSDILIKSGFDVSKKDSSVYTAFFNAAVYESTKILNYFIKAGIDVNEPDPRWLNFTALHYAAANRCVKSLDALIKAGADVNALSKLNETALDSVCSLDGYRYYSDRQCLYAPSFESCFLHLMKVLSRKKLIAAGARRSDPNYRKEPLRFSRDIALKSLPSRVPPFGYSGY